MTEHTEQQHEGLTNEESALRTELIRRLHEEFTPETMFKYPTSSGKEVSMSRDEAIERCVKYMADPAFSLEDDILPMLRGWIDEGALPEATPQEKAEHDQRRQNAAPYLGRQALS